MPSRRRQGVDPAFRHLVVLSTAGFSGFSLLLSVTPLWAARGGATGRGAGLVTGVLMLVTIVTQPVVPALLRRLGHGATLTTGLVLLGLPAPCYALSTRLAVLNGVSAVRGAGFAVLTVAGAALVAELAPAERRGEAAGIYGLGSAIPNLALLPLGVWLSQRVGFGWVFAAGAVPLLGVPAAIGLDRSLPHRPGATGRVHHGPRSHRVLLAVAAPAVLLFVVTLAGGGVVTFLPLALDAAVLSSSALLVLGVVASLARWVAGWIADRVGPEGLLAPGLALAAAGMLSTAAATSRPGWATAVVPAMLLFGVGYGAVQSLTLVTAFSRVSPSRYGTASAAWNLAFDAGTGTGAVALGAVAQAASYGTAFLVAAVVVAAALPGTLLVGRRARRGPSRSSVRP